MIDERTLEHWKKMGKHFGFPQCCIDEFCKLELPRPVRKLCGTGYIPCAQCNEKTEEELIAEITKNRQHDKPFPRDD